MLCPILADYVYALPQIAFDNLKLVTANTRTQPPIRTTLVRIRLNRPTSLLPKPRVSTRDLRGRG